MKDLKDKAEIAIDKIGGGLNETAGKISGNKQLELKGKLQVSKAELEKKMDIKDNINEIKENIADKIIKKMDKK